MTFVTRILGKILGNKSERDIKETAPLIEQIKMEYKRVTVMSNDELRNEANRLREIIKERTKPEEENIAELKETAEESEIQESEKIYEQIGRAHV